MILESVLNSDKLGYVRVLGKVVIDCATNGNSVRILAIVSDAVLLKIGRAKQ